MLPKVTGRLWPNLIRLSKGRGVFLKSFVNASWSSGPQEWRQNMQSVLGLSAGEGLIRGFSLTVGLPRLLTFWAFF